LHVKYIYYIFIRSPVVVAEKADRTAQSRIAVQNAELLTMAVADVEIVAVRWFTVCF